MYNIMALKHFGQNYIFTLLLMNLMVLNAKTASVATVEADVTAFLSEVCDIGNWTVL